MAEVNVGCLAFISAQYRCRDWAPAVPSKNLVKMALMVLPKIDVSLVGFFSQPFSEKYFLSLQDRSDQNADRRAGLTRKEICALSLSLKRPLDPKDNFKEQVNSDFILSAGLHVAVMVKTEGGMQMCLREYDFDKQKKMEAVTDKGSTGAPDAMDQVNAPSAHAPLKKWPAHCSSATLDSSIQIRRFALCLMQSLIFDLCISRFLVSLSTSSCGALAAFLPSQLSFEGLAASSKKKPLTIKGIIRHGNPGKLDFFTGGLAVGFTRYRVQAAGFYGQASPLSGQPSNFMSIFARLNGPLAHFQFGSVVGASSAARATKSDLRIPTTDEMMSFPFIDTHKLDGHGGSACDALQQLTSPATGGWFQPRADTYWAMPGMNL